MSRMFGRHTRKKAEAAALAAEKQYFRCFECNEFLEAPEFGFQDDEIEICLECLGDEE